MTEEKQERKMSVLVAEDDKVSRMTLSACLQGWGYQVIAVENGRQALEALTQEAGPRLALLDWEMPEMDGTEVCMRIRSLSGLPFRYLIVLTGRQSEDDIVMALAKGGDDYITKPWTPGELRARLGVGQRMVQLHEQLEEHARQLALAAQTDYLTQIWNRSSVLKRLEEELARARRENIPLTVLMLDVDHFKRVNDTHGHSAGDDVLKEVSNRLRHGCRPYDVVGRYGGEEFLAVVPEAPYETAESLAQRFREQVAATPMIADGASISVTVSIGGAWLAAGGQTDAEILVKTADTMLYRAKESGRNRVEMCPL
ncbi:MAG TPA: diguanylate cyclase [Candidatus Hydrogenedentes bacterium]|nr:diguanylate cyclase [Candidatus Hydrogenedentota bacterium]